jgi:hypothetical protein
MKFLRDKSNTYNVCVCVCVSPKLESFGMAEK